MQFFRHLLLLPYKTGIKERGFVVQSSVKHSQKSILKQNNVIYKLGHTL